MITEMDIGLLCNLSPEYVFTWMEDGSISISDKKNEKIAVFFMDDTKGMLFPIKNRPLSHEEMNKLMAVIAKVIESKKSLFCTFDE